MAVEGFVDICAKCLDAGFKFPALGDSGMPNFAMGCFMANMAGIKYVLDFLPPSPSNPPSIPKVDLFLKAFMGSIKLPDSYPPFSFSPLSIPGKGGSSDMDLSGMFKLIGVAVLLPFTIFKEIILSIISLQVKIPTLPQISLMFDKIAADVGLPKLEFGFCLAKATHNLITGMVPV